MLAKDIVSLEEMKALLSEDEFQEDAVGDNPGVDPGKSGRERSIDELVMTVRTLQSQVDVLAARVRMLEHSLYGQGSAEAAAASGLGMRGAAALAEGESQAPDAAELKGSSLSPRSERHGKKKKGLFSRGEK